MEIDLAAANIATVILAAGTSSRMGTAHKLRLPLADGRTVLQHAVGQALAWSPLRCIVVMQPGMDDLRAALADLPLDIITNPDYASGMSSSMRVGGGALGPDVAAALILLGDEPYISHEVISALLTCYDKEGRAITIPVYGDVPGPPTLFRRAVFPELLALTGDEGGRSVVRRDPARVSRVLLAATLMPPDLDTPEDYRRLLEQLQGR